MASNKSVYEGGEYDSDEDAVKEQSVRKTGHRPTLNYTPSDRFLSSNVKKRTQTINYEGSDINLNYHASEKDFV